MAKPHLDYYHRIAEFYDRRVNNPLDLNARMGQIASRPAHHHAGIVRTDEAIPGDAAGAQAWLYRTEEIMCDYIWFVIAGLSSRRLTRLLDLGCGEGGTAARFSELAGDPDMQVTGITLSPKQRQAARKNCPSGDFRVGNMLTAKLPGKHKFDLLYSIEATEYLGSPGLARLMERAAGEWLAPGGLLVIIAGSRSPHLRVDDPVVWAFDAHYKTRLASSHDYIRLASQEGFRLIAEIDLGPATIPYWKARRDNPVLRNSQDGVVETMIAQVLEDGRGEYRLWAWHFLKG